MLSKMRTVTVAGVFIVAALVVVHGVGVSGLATAQDQPAKADAGVQVYAVGHVTKEGKLTSRGGAKCIVRRLNVGDYEIIYPAEQKGVPVVAITNDASTLPNEACSVTIKEATKKVVRVYTLSRANGGHIDCGFDFAVFQAQDITN